MDNRMDLYNQGLLDQEIADRSNCTLGAIQLWRYKRKLKTNRVYKPVINKPLHNHPAKVSFRKVLPDDCHNDMLRFLFMVDHYQPVDIMKLMILVREGVIK